MQTQQVAVLSALIVILSAAVVRMQQPQEPTPAMSLPVPNPFIYIFEKGTLEESGSMNTSRSQYWWLDSGGRLIFNEGQAKTMQGQAPVGDQWQVSYAATNPRDTDGGAHPQNVLRLIARSVWEDVRVELLARVDADHFSTSPNRNESNGILLMSRYRDSQTLYYAGVRVDGTAVIKKKYQGRYYTMAQKVIFPGTYDRDRGTNLIPHGTWIGIRAETEDDADGVTIRLFVQYDEGDWRHILTAHDDGKIYTQTPVIHGPAFIGVRSDFMDVRFKDFRAEQI